MSTTPQFAGTPTEAQRLLNQSTVYRTAIKSALYDLRVACPGIIQSFNSAKMTVTVALAIREKINLKNAQGQSNVQDLPIPTLLDVPIVLPRGGGFELTLPVQAGDECLVVFGDMCMDAWWETGDVSNQQRLRRHSLSDGFAILAPSSVPKAGEVASYSGTEAQLRNDAGTVALSVGATAASVAAGGTSVEVDGTYVTLAGLLALTGAPVASGTSATLSFPVKIGSVTYYLKLSATP